MKKYFTKCLSFNIVFSWTSDHLLAAQNHPPWSPSRHLEVHLCLSLNQHKRCFDFFHWYSLLVIWYFLLVCAYPEKIMSWNWLQGENDRIELLIHLLLNSKPDWFPRMLNHSASQSRLYWTCLASCKYSYCCIFSRIMYSSFHIVFMST